ncbi:MAG: UvrD-helicase domain-containing protein [Burkholderiales bacterium]|nr:UvrD-helicase domain-containing protein [Burkholderiales bacterium]
MTATVPDFAQRRDALDPRRSFIVQAPAGSGKTELLIQRYLLLLARVDHAEEIIAVTFTKKAAGEMRERVLRALVDAQAGKAPESVHEALTLELAAAALRRDREAGWFLADNPAQLRILTIDALCAGLTRQMPLLSRFGAQPDSVEDADVLYRQAAQATIALVNESGAVAADVENLLSHLDNDVARAGDLLVDMLARRDQWLRHVHGREREELESALQHARATAVQRLREAIPVQVCAELGAIADFVFGNLGLASFVSDVDSWAALAGVFLTDEDAWRKRLTKNEGFPAGKAAQPWKERALSLFAALEDNTDARIALAEMRHVPPAHYSDSQWQVLGAILRLLPHAVAQLKLVFQVRRQVDFTEVAQSALYALGTDDAPTDLTLALDYRIRHLLIDEFQDTSISQFELVARLTAGWLPDDGRTVFAVGDPMQSIYRFREAEVGLFLRARAEGIAGVELQPIALSSNFRSQSGVVEWVNAAFARILPAAENIASGAVPYTPSVPTREALAGAAVSVHPLFDGHGSMEEAQRVTQIVIAARAADPAAKIAILARTRGHLREIVPALKAAGLRFRAIDIEPLGQRPVVQDLLALTRALAHPGDRLAWLAVLRAPWCGLTLADLHALAADNAGMTLWDALNDAQRTGQLSNDGRVRVARVRAALEPSLLRRVRAPLREQVAGTWYALGGPACVAFETDLEDAETFFRDLDQHEDAGELPDRAAFEVGLEQLYALADVEADDTLQIMTIHKAKGLEFDVVIVPGLAKSSRSDDKKLFLWTEQPDAHGMTELLLAPINATGEDGDAIYRWIARFHTEKQALEYGRLLYVAATRARWQLHLLGSVRVSVDEDGGRRIHAPSPRSLLGKLWPVVEAEYEAALRDAPMMPHDTAAQPWVIDQRLQRLPAGWALPAAPPPAQWTPPQDQARMQDDLEFSWAGETARRIGSVVHRWLQRIADENAAGWDAARIAALQPAIRLALAAQGVGEDELAQAVARAQQALTHCVSDERGRWVLGAQVEGRSELRLSGVSDGQIVNVVIDRTFIDAEGVRWIIDYKTSMHEGGDAAAFLDNERERYHVQLERYARLMQAGGAPQGDLLRSAPQGDLLRSAQRIRLGLYFPLLGGWREWGYESR